MEDGDKAPNLPGGDPGSLQIGPIVTQGIVTHGSVSCGIGTHDSAGL